jgi:hypothetical protein
MPVIWCIIKLVDNESMTNSAPRLTERFLTSKNECTKRFSSEGFESRQSNACSKIRGAAEREGSCFSGKIS